MNSRHFIITMKEFKVSFTTQFGSKDCSETKIIQAESRHVAAQQFVNESQNTLDQYVLVSGIGILSSESIHENPHYIKIEKIETPKISNIQSATSEPVNHGYDSQLEKLNIIIELQEKQLGWIRIIALPVLLSIIFFFLRTLTGHN